MRYPPYVSHEQNLHHLQNSVNKPPPKARVTIDDLRTHLCVINVTDITDLRTTTLSSPSQVQTPIEEDKQDADLMS